MRKRSAMLEAVELLRDTCPDFTVSQIVALLHIADEETPLPLPDLRRRAGMTGDGVWKNAQALAEIEAEAGETLILVKDWTMRAIVAAELTPAGRALCNALDVIIREAHPIVLDGRTSAAAADPRPAKRPA
jgi:hypothetical protein